MLSPGTSYKRVPKELEENKKFRQKILKECKSSPASQREVLRVCEEDILFYINCFVYQYNPKKPKDEIGPFITWDFQDGALYEILRCVEGQEDLVIKKSRDMGASWLCLIALSWLYQFKRWKKFGLISNDEKAVDKPGDSKSLFWKLLFMHERLPPWMMDPVDGETRRHMSLVHSRSHSSITGGASTATTFVGDKMTAMFVDEFTLHTKDREFYDGSRDVTNCRIFNGTPMGTHKKMHDLVKDPSHKKLTMMWWDHPDKNKGLYQYDPREGRAVPKDPKFDYGPNFEFKLDGKLRNPWYDNEEKTRTPRSMALNVDCDDLGATTQFFDQQLIRSLTAEYAEMAIFEGDVEVDQEEGTVKRLVRLNGVGSPLRIWCDIQDGRPPISEYVAGVDTSAGQGASNSCLSIGDALTGQKVLEYTTPNLRPEAFAGVVAALCRLFKNEEGQGAKVAWEKGGPGTTMGLRVLELGYRNVYYPVSEDRPYSNPSESPGWSSTNPNAMRILLDDYQEALRKRQFVNHSKEALEECLYFAYQPNGDVKHQQFDSKKDPSGARANHGDRVVADGLCWKLMAGRARQISLQEKAHVVKRNTMEGRRVAAEKLEREKARWGW